MTTTTADQRAPAAIEFHSIDYIPVSERHGKVWNQATLWFLANAELATLAVGLIGISLGLSLFWALVAIVLGEIFGTFFMAFHAVQGPRMGIPQLLQSRPQFGYYGALIPQAIGVFLYVGFNVFNTIIGGQALAAVTGLNSQLSILIMAGVALLLTLYGYDWIHWINKWGSYIFLVVIAVVAAYQVSQAPYVSDYSRYLKPTETVRSTFLWTYFGSAIGSFWMIALGALLLAGNPTAQTVDAVAAGGNAIFNGFGTISLAIALIGLVSVIALNLYSGSLAAIAAFDAVHPIQPSVTLRVIGILFIAVLGTAGSLLLPQDFLSSYSNFLTILLYFLTPWTAVNLVDFYFVRRGNYAIAEIFNPAGIYRRWNWRGLVSYFVGFAVMIPFFSTNLYVGPIANALGKADFSIFIGLPVSALLYYFLARNQDLTEERRLAMTEADALEAAAEAGQAPSAAPAS